MTGVDEGWLSGRLSGAIRIGGEEEGEGGREGGESRRAATAGTVTESLTRGYARTT